MPVGRDWMAVQTLFNCDSPRHSQPDDHSATVGEQDQQLFSPSVHRFDDLLLADMVHRETPFSTSRPISNHVSAVDPNLFNQATSHHLLDLPANRFNFRKFWH
jgi:hypothetical protein